MILPLLNKNQKQLDRFLAININARDIRVLTFYHDGESQRIIGSGIKPLDEGSVKNGLIINKEDVVEKLKSAVKQATGDIENTIKNAIIGVDGGMCTGITTTVKSKHPPATLEKKDIKELYSKIQEAAYIQVKNKLLHSNGDPDCELEIITTRDVYIKEDNNQVDTLEGSFGTSIEVAQFNAFSPEDNIKRLERVAREANLNILAIGSQAYALVQWIISSPTNISDFVLINIAEDSTDVSVVFGKGIVSTQSLHIGFLHFLEGISSKMGLTKQEAANVLKVYISGKLTESEMEVVRTCLREVLEIWLSGITLLFEEFSDVRTFGPKVYLTGCGIEIRDVVEAIQKEPWAKSIPFKSPPEFEKLSFGQLNKISDSTGKSQTSEWINTAALSIIYNEMFGE